MVSGCQDGSYKAQKRFQMIRIYNIMMNKHMLIGF